jgi:hypothetical protein
MNKPSVIFALVCVLGIGALAFLPAQQNQNNFGGGVSVSGAVTAGHVATFINGSTIQDGGAAGLGTVTNTGGNLTANSLVVGAGGSDTKVLAGFTTDGLAQLNIGPADGTNNGAWGLKGKTSGTATCTAPAVAGTATNPFTCSNAIAVPGGAAGTPSLANSAVPTTGLFFGSGNSIGLSSGSTTYFGSLSTQVGVRTGTNFGFANGDPTSVALRTSLGEFAAGVVGVGASQTTTDTSGTILANGGYGVKLVATSAITGPVPVKADTSNANQVVVTTTGDTGSGIPIGICTNSPGAAGNCTVITSGISALVLGTGTCSIGNFVIVDTTTSGRVKCTASYSAGTVIGVAMAANSTVGTGFNVMVGLR